MGGTTPELKPTKLIVLCAFDRGEDGELGYAFEPREMLSEERAVSLAKEMATYHAGVITWTRAVRPDEGHFGEPDVLFKHGEVPDMD